MSRKSSRPNGARTTKYSFIRITEGSPSKGDLKWADQVLSAEPLGGLIDFLAADAPEDGISEEVILSAQTEGLNQTTLMAVVSNIYMSQHNAAVRSEHKRIYREQLGYANSDVAVNLLIVGPLERCRRVIEVSDGIVSRNPLLPTAQDISFADAGLSAPPVVVRNFLTEVAEPPLDGGARLHLSIDLPSGPTLFEVTPPEEIMFGDDVDVPMEDIHAVLNVDDDSLTYAGTPDGERLKMITASIPFTAMAARYAAVNGFDVQQVLVLVSVLQLVSVEAPDRFRVLVLGNPQKAQLLTALAIAVWGFGMHGLRGRGTQN